jgi:radical SAM protein with 4Fe4S-binding SPASM domain
LSGYLEELKLPDFRLWKRAEEKRVPLSTEIELTERCNNNCVHCYINLAANDEEAKKRELSFEEIRDIVDETVEMGCLWWLITGGEPLLREDFADIYLYLKKKGLLTSVFTNATLITPELMSLFKKYPPRELEITVYGITQETYERITRTPGSFEAFMKGINLLQKENVPFTLKAMALRSNINELEAIKDFCKPVSKGPFRFDPFLHLRLRPNGKRNRQIKNERLSPKEIVAIELGDEERKNGLLKQICEEKKIGQETAYFEDDNHLFYCGAGRTSFTIDPYGFFKLCGSLSHPDCVYDLKKGSLREAWEEFVPQVRSMRTEDEECKRKCLSCSLINLCMWCPATAYLECGKLDRHIEDFCQIAHARAEVLASIE